MQKPVESDHNYVVHLFEMESCGYSNKALEGDDEYFSENWTTSRTLGKGREGSFAPSGNVGHCTETSGKKFLLENGGSDKEKNGENSEAEQQKQCNGMPYVLSPAGKKLDRKENCSVKRLTNSHVYINVVNRQKCLGKGKTKGKKSGREEAKRDPPTVLKCAEKQQKRKCCRPREIARLQVVTLFMAAAGLTLVVMIISGKITCFPESLKGMKLVSYL